MPPRTWVTPGTDLAFVLDRRPRDLDELLRWGKPWIELFSAWYARQSGKDDPDVQAWFPVAEHYVSKTRGRVQIKEKRFETWNDLVKKEFFNECGELRAWLEEARAKAKEDLEEEARKAAEARKALAEKLKNAPDARTRREAKKALEALDNEPGSSWWESSAREKKLAAKTREVMAGAIARERAVEENTAKGGNDQDLTPETLTFLDAYLISYKRSVYPELRVFYQRLDGAAKAVEDAKFKAAYARVGNSIMSLSTAESRLRHAIDCARNPGVGAQPVSEEIREANAEPDAGPQITFPLWIPQDVRAEVLDAWEGYAQALAKLTNAQVAAAGSFLRWAEDDTRKKIQKNFATEHPGWVKMELAVQSALLVTSTTLQVLSLTPLAPAVGPAAIALVLAQAAVRAGIAGLNKVKSIQDSKDPEVLRRLIGTEITASENRKLRKTAESAAWATALTTPTLDAVAASVTGVAGATIAKVVPLVGQAVYAADLALQAKALHDPGEFVKGEDYEALQGMTEEAFRERNTEIPSAAVEFLNRRDDDAPGAQRVKINGVEGILSNGHFAPDNLGEILFAQALTKWSEGGSGPEFATITTTGGPVPVEKTVLGTVERFAVHVETVASSSSTDRGWVCTAVASGIDPHFTWATAEWDITFLLTPEGRGIFNQATFRSLTLQSPDVQQSSITTRQVEIAQDLLSQCAPDEGEKLMAAIEWALGVPIEQKFTVEQGRLIYEDGMASCEFAELLKDVTDVLSLKEKFTSGIEVTWGDVSNYTYKYDGISAAFKAAASAARS